MPPRSGRLVTDEAAKDWRPLELFLVQADGRALGNVDRRDFRWIGRRDLGGGGCVHFYELVGTTADARFLIIDRAGHAHRLGDEIEPTPAAQGRCRHRGR